jgi:hypothetical protein
MFVNIVGRHPECDDEVLRNASRECRSTTLNGPRLPKCAPPMGGVCEERGVPLLKHDPQPAEVAEKHAANRRVYTDSDRLTIEFS